MKVVQQLLREVMQQAQQAETDELMECGSNGAPFIQKFFTQGVMVGAVKGL